MEYEKPSYFAVIPANVRYDEKLKPNEKLLFGEITALSSKDGYCWASNSYFAKLYNVSSVTVSNWVTNLVKCGYIIREIIKDEETKEIKQRKLYINSIIPINDKISTPINNKMGTPINEIIKDNNTSINNTSINIYSRVDKDIPYKEVIEYLNEKAGTKYRYTTNKTKTLIRARYEEGFELDDFKSVIDKKVNTWLNTDMSKYLRPETLFGTKFEGYLNEFEIVNNKSNDILNKYSGKEYDWLG